MIMLKDLRNEDLFVSCLVLTKNHGYANILS